MHDFPALNHAWSLISPTPSTSIPSTPTPSEYSASTPTPSAYTSSALISSEPSSSAPISSAHTPRAFLTRVSPSKPDVHADVTPAAPESYVTVVRRSYPKRLNFTSNKSARVSNASRESGSRVSRESSNARRYVRRGGITGNSTSGGLRAIPLPVRDFFVYRVNSDDTTDVLSGYLRSHGIVPIAVVPKNQQGSKFNSFKVTVNIANVEKMMEPSTWQCGVCVRRWREQTNTHL